MKNVQISEDLFALLCYYFLEGEHDDMVVEEIEKQLNEKLEAMIRRQIFSQYKTAQNGTEREKLRQEYLDRVGVLESFRSATECPSEHL